MNSFTQFANAIRAKFSELPVTAKFFSTIDGDALYVLYLSSFPGNTNPIYLERTEHDCNCCKQFLRNMGGLVYFVDNQRHSIWEEYESFPYPYDVVAQILHFAVMEAPISGPFFSSETGYGKATSASKVGKDTILWHHFSAKVPAGARAGIRQSVAQAVGQATTNYQVFQRGLEQFTVEIIDTVMELIRENLLYRGMEHQDSLRQFRTRLQYYQALPAEGTARQDYVWRHQSCNVALLRNSVIGTLLVDLAEGKPLEQAVASFEAKVAPQNYRRTSAPVSSSMVAKMIQSLDDAGLRGAQERRHAKLQDVSINDIIWADTRAKNVMQDSLDALLQETAAISPANGRFGGAVGIQEFIDNYLPGAVKLEILTEQKLLPKLMTLTAPRYPDTGNLFKWDNDFAWSYIGNMTDSIKERVKAAGGNINAKLRFSLSWFNRDDLDIHVLEPNGKRIFHANRDGKLDVDANAPHAIRTTTPVENVAFVAPMDGEYQVIINQYQQRDSNNYGFDFQMESDGKIHNFHYPFRVVGDVRLGVFVVKGGLVVSMDLHPDIKVEDSRNSELWGITTNQFVEVDTLMLSPNHWGTNQSGNKHWFFVLNGCINPDPVRGIYNEYLHSNLNEHRKAFELLASRSMIEPSDQQMSGLGFSSTIPVEFTARVTYDIKVRTFTVTI